MLNFFYNVPCTFDVNLRPKATLLKYVLYKWKSLKDLVLYNMIFFVTMEKILASNLPQSLFAEIMARKMN